MGTFRTSFGLVKANFSKWKKNARIITVFFLLLVLLAYSFGGVPVYLKRNELTCTPFLLPCVFSAGINSNGSFKVLFFFISILLFSKAPFLDDQSVFMILRTGRRRWLLGEMLYILVTALILTTAVWIVILLAAAPGIEKDPYEWGSLVYRVIANRSIQSEQAVLRGFIVHPNLLIAADPVVSSLFVTVFVYCDLVILGLLIYAGNIWFPRKSLGIAIAVLLVLIDPVIEALTGAPMKFLLAFSPMSWCSLNLYRAISGSGVLTVNLVMILYTVWICMLVLLIAYKTKRMDIIVYDAE